jgi:hypothetical protein
MQCSKSARAPIDYRSCIIDTDTVVGYHKASRAIKQQTWANSPANSRQHNEGFNDDKLCSGRRCSFHASCSVCIAIPNIIYDVHYPRGLVRIYLTFRAL